MSEEEVFARRPLPLFSRGTPSTPVQNQFSPSHPRRLFLKKVPESKVVVPSNPPAIGSPSSNYAFHSYRLSYMQSDRVLALLKALGYSTVEFSVGRGESVNESIFTAFKDVQRYPLVVKILDAAKTSLMQPPLDKEGEGQRVPIS